MADIFKLVGSVFVETDQANENLEKTDKKASNVGETFGKIAGGAAKVGTAVVGAASAAVAGVMELANNTASAADVVDKASIRMGISAESYQEIAYAAGQCGVEMTTMERAAKMLEGTDLNMDDAMEQIMSLATAEERSAKAAELFGETVAYKMSPLIEQSGESYDDLIERANELGLVMSQEDVTAGVVLGDTISDVTQAFDRLVVGLGSAVVPMVQQVADMIIEYLPMIQELFGSLSPIIQQMFEQLVPPLMQLAESLLPLVFSLIEQILPPITEVITNILPVVISLMETIMPVVVQLAEMVLPIIVDLISMLAPLLTPILQLLSPILELAVAILKPLMTLIDFIIKPIIELLSTGLKIALEAIGPIIEGVVEFFTDAFDLIGEGLETLGEFFASIWEGIKNGLKAAINACIGFLNGIITGLNVLLAPLRAIIVAVGNVFGADWSMDQIAIPLVPYLAKGGEIIGEGSAIVGEAGAELINLPRGATVTPLTDNGAVLPGMAELNAKVDQLIGIVGSMTNMGVYINGSALVGKIAPEMDKTLGMMATKNSRRV